MVVRRLGSLWNKGRTLYCASGLCLRQFFLPHSRWCWLVWAPLLLTSSRFSLFFPPSFCLAGSTLGPTCWANRNGEATCIWVMHEHSHAPIRNSISHHFWLQASYRFKTGVNWCLSIRTGWALLQGWYMIASTKPMCSCRPIISCTCNHLWHYLWLCD